MGSKERRAEKEAHIKRQAEIRRRNVEAQQKLDRTLDVIKFVSDAQ